MTKKLIVSGLIILSLSSSLLSVNQTAFANEVNDFQYKSINHLPAHEHVGSGYTHLWTYQYSSGPYAFFYNQLNHKWKIIQVIDTTTYTFKVISDGIVGSWAKYTHSSNSAWYYNANHAKLQP